MSAKKINLALQGGGAHGAYTWGALDRILQDEDLVIEGISGTSAGAMNGVVLANGYLKGGREGAREALAHFWKSISDISAFGPFNQNPIEQWLLGWNLDWSPAYHYFDALSRILSPYDVNPLNLNPLRNVLDEQLDLPALHDSGIIKLFVTATHVSSGQPRVFDCHEITTEVLLASACIPFMFQAVEIEGEDYWDGGYMGNPAIWPLIYRCESEDVLLVQVNPLHRDGVPKKAGDIINRLNEITFNSSLISEMRAIQFVQRLLHEGRLERTRYKDMKIHLVYSPEELKDLNASSKLNTGWAFFKHLYDVGYQEAEDWLKAHKHDVGTRSTVNITEKFLRGPGRHQAYDALGREKRKTNKHEEAG